MENKFMRLALNEAQKAIEEGEMPVGAVIVRDGQVIATGHNVRNVTHDPTLHAEIVAIRKACEKVGDWRLSDCDLYVTLEPCVMCSGAIINSRMRSVYFGAYDAEYGGAGGRIDLFSKSYFGSNTRVYGGIMEEECTSMLKSFFASLREGKKTLI
ncbi:MAG: tRNA adenosine(34) deaminase TadA [Clostridia bacterium]|nr:tRNA adenosine(34) deaminase TadA [Clostridia bacterium]